MHYSRFFLNFFSSFVLLLLTQNVDQPNVTKMQELFPKSGVHLPLAVVLNAYTEAEYDANKLSTFCSTSFSLMKRMLYPLEENKEFPVEKDYLTKTK